MNPDPADFWRSLVSSDHRRKGVAVRVESVLSRPIGDERELRAEVVFEGDPETRLPLWFRQPDAGEPAAAGDPFLAALLVPAMALNEDLQIDAPVSAPLLEAAQKRIGPVMQGWFPDFAEVSMGRSQVVDPVPPAASDAIGSFFSGGVDSWYTLLTRRDEISHVIFFHGFEIDVDDTALARVARENIALSARDLGKTVLPIASNVKQVAEGETRARLRRLGRERWSFFSSCYFGSMLVACGLCLAPPLRRVIVPGSWSERFVGSAGSHPLIEPNWSTPGVDFDLDGLEASRIDKIRSIAELDPGAFRRLRVCVGRPSEGLNCGRCFKCIRTQLELRVVGALDRGARFQHPLDMEEAKIARIVIDGELWSDVIREAEAIGDLEVADAARVIIGERFHWRRFVDGLRLRMTGAGRKTLRHVRLYAKERHHGQ
jgi:hypothetical protein